MASPFWVTAETPAAMLPDMDDQNEAWRRLTEARLRNLEMAIDAPRVRRARSGKPFPAAPYEPGDRKPLTRWIEIRVLAIEMLIRLWLDADARRADDLDVEPYEDVIDSELAKLDGWSDAQVEPDLSRRETMAMIQMARVILLESHTWPLIELEEMQG